MFGRGLQCDFKRQIADQKNDTMSGDVTTVNQIKRVLKMSPGKVIKKLCCYEEIYTIAYRPRENKSLWDSEQLSFTPVPYHDDFWYADPIMITHNGDTYLFAECFDMRTQKGVLGCALFDEAGNLSGFRSIIEEPYHLSFPMVFEWGDKFYMIPESSDNLSLNLYCSEGDMFHWEKIKEFPTEEPLVDTVVLSCWGESVELLSSVIHPEDPLQYRWKRLRLHRTEGSYILEEMDTVDGCEDYSRKSRMAGKLANVNGKLLLPIQESTETDYGINLYLNDFSENNLRQLKGKKLTPADIHIEGIDEKQRIGVHSYAVLDQYEVVDIRYFRFSPKNRMRKIIYKLKQIGRNKNR